MSSLSEEQLKQIARNRELALLKKRKYAENSVTDSCNTSSLQKVPSHLDMKQKCVTNYDFKDSSASLPKASVPATIRLVSESQFTVYMPFHTPSVDLFRTIPGKIYDPNTKRWSFPLSSYHILEPKLQKIATVNPLPKPIVNALLETEKENEIDLSKIDKALLDSLFPFQKEGIRFGINKDGRCLIADDMGLGKTIQALGIAHYYHENWPLLILCPSSVKFPWEEAIQIFLPSVNPFYVTVMTSRKDVINEAKVVICSYDLLKTCSSEINKIKFGVIIMVSLDLNLLLLSVLLRVEFGCDSRRFANFTAVGISSGCCTIRYSPHTNTLTQGCEHPLTEWIAQEQRVVIKGQDESHCLKSLKTTRTKASLEVAKKCKNVILLSGTPALSRPMELYSQIIALINPRQFLSFHDFGMRYCDGKVDNYGWNFNGSSNTEELEIFLKKKIMIRRLKSEVITQLPSKIRKVIMLNTDSVTKKMKALANALNVQKGNEMKKTLLLYYSLTASAKTKAVCDYIEQKLETNQKMLVFAHHTTVIEALCEMIMKKNIDFIKIDGSTNSQKRKHLCDEFQNREKCRVAVLSLRAANSGITLTAAQLVIFAELYWNPGDLTQAEDRAHRIGQQGSVIVEYLVAKETADEHIWNLVQSKLNFLNKVGLSKDCFKEVDVKMLNKPKQLTLTSLFHKESVEDNATESIENCDDFEFFNEMDIYDELFENINLEEIESENDEGSIKMNEDS